MPQPVWFVLEPFECILTRAQQRCITAEIDSVSVLKQRRSAQTGNLPTVKNQCIPRILVVHIESVYNLLLLFGESEYCGSLECNSLGWLILSFKRNWYKEREL